MISNGLFEIFFRTTAKSRFFGSFVKNSMQLVQLPGQSIILLQWFLNLFLFLEQQTLEFWHPDNGRVSKTLLSVATGHSEEISFLKKKHKILIFYRLVGKFFRTSAKTCYSGILVENSMQLVQWNISEKKRIHYSRLILRMFSLLEQRLLRFWQQGNGNFVDTVFRVSGRTFEEVYTL